MIIKTNKNIGIVGWKTGEKSFGATETYLELIRRFGKPRIIMPEDDFLPELDLVIMPGGMDVTPSSYGEAPGFATGNTDVFKQYFFDEKLEAYVEAGTPIFGICLGMQMLATYFGCGLTQDLIYHPQSPDRWATAHKIYNTVVVDEKTKQLKIVKKGASIDVNSHHHQAVTMRTLNKETITPLWFTDNDDNHITGDGFIIEAFKVKDKPIYGVQYHPEELLDWFTIEVLHELLGVSEQV